MMQEKDLQYGEKITVDVGERIYKPGDPLTDKPIYYIIAGLIKIEFSLAGNAKFPIYLLPDSVFGLIESIENCSRSTSAYSMEKTILYRWDKENFDTASSVTWELAMTAIIGLTQKLRILDAEFGDRLLT